MLEKTCKMQTKRGFTLMELMVAICAAVILSMTAWNVYGSCHRTFLHLQKTYNEETAKYFSRLVQIKKDVRDHHKHPLKILF